MDKTNPNPQNNNNRKRHQKFVRKKGRKFPIKTKMNNGKIVAFESIWDTTEIAYNFAVGLQKSRPKWRIFFMRIPYYFEVEEYVLGFIKDFNNSVIEQNIKYFDDADVKKTIDNMLEHQRNNRLSLFSSINYIHSLLLMSRINKIHHLHTHFNAVVIANYFNSIKAFSINNQYISKTMNFMYEQFIPKADNTFLIDIDSMNMKRHLQSLKYEHFFEEDIDKYKIALLNLMNHKRHANKLKIIQYNQDHNKMLLEIYNNFYYLTKKYNNVNSQIISDSNRLTDAV